MVSSKMQDGEPIEFTENARLLGVGRVRGCDTSRRSWRERARLACVYSDELTNLEDVSQHSTAEIVSGGYADCYSVRDT